MCNLGLGCLGCFAQLLLPKCIPLSVWLLWFVFPLSTTHFVELMGFVAAQILQHNLERFLWRLSHSVCQLSDNADQVLSTPPALCVCLNKCWCCVHQWTSMCCAVFGISQLSGYSFLAAEVMPSRIQLGAPGAHVQDPGWGGGLYNPGSPCCLPFTCPECCRVK